MTDKPIKARLTAVLEELTKPTSGEVLKIKRGDNFGPILGKLYVLQEMASWAKSELESAWASAATEGVLPPDDDLRAEQGERIVTESEQFSVIVSVAKPRATFSRDKYITAVAKKYKIDRFRLEGMVASATTDSKPPLSKKVLEA